MMKNKNPSERIESLIGESIYIHPMESYEFIDIIRSLKFSNSVGYD